MRYASSGAFGLIAFAIALAMVSDLPVNATSTHKRHVAIDGTQCDHDVTDLPATLHRGPKDKIDWTVDNSCPTQTNVLLCVYRNDAVNNPFEPCKGDGDIGAPFPVPANDGRKGVTCTVRKLAGDSPPTYYMQVLVGAEIPTDNRCPEHPQREPRDHHHGKDTVRTHILDFDVQP